jgi:hypothetical protein
MAPQGAISSKKMTMQYPTIRLAYRQYIDVTATTPFAQKIFNATWSEFLIQRQSFSKGLEIYAWEDIRRSFPKSDPALPYKVGFAVAGTLTAQNHRIPGLADALGDYSIPFDRYHFHLIASDARDRTTHRVSITYYTGDLTLLETLGDQLLLTQTPPQTLQLKLQPGLAIISYQLISNALGSPLLTSGK